MSSGRGGLGRSSATQTGEHCGVGKTIGGVEWKGGGEEGGVFWTAEDGVDWHGEVGKGTGTTWQTICRSRQHCDCGLFDLRFRLSLRSKMGMMSETSHGSPSGRDGRQRSTCTAVNVVSFRILNQWHSRVHLGMCSETPDIGSMDLRNTSVSSQLFILRIAHNAQSVIIMPIPLLILLLIIIIEKRMRVLIRKQVYHESHHCGKDESEPPYESVDAEEPREEVCGGYRSCWGDEDDTEKVTACPGNLSAICGYIFAMIL